MATARRPICRLPAKSQLFTPEGNRPNPILGQVIVARDIDFVEIEYDVVFLADLAPLLAATFANVAAESRFLL